MGTCFSWHPLPESSKSLFRTDKWLRLHEQGAVVPWQSFSRTSKLVETSIYPVQYKLNIRCICKKSKKKNKSELLSVNKNNKINCFFFIF